MANKFKALERYINPMIDLSIVNGAKNNYYQNFKILPHSSFSGKNKEVFAKGSPVMLKYKKNLKKWGFRGVPNSTVNEPIVHLQPTDSRANYINHFENNLDIINIYKNSLKSVSYFGDKTAFRVNNNYLKQDDNSEKLSNFKIIKGSDSRIGGMSTQNSYKKIFNFFKELMLSNKKIAAKHFSHALLCENSIQTKNNQKSILVKKLIKLATLGLRSKIIVAKPTNGIINFGNKNTYTIIILNSWENNRGKLRLFWTKNENFLVELVKKIFTKVGKLSNTPKSSLLNKIQYGGISVKDICKIAKNKVIFLALGLQSKKIRKGTGLTYRRGVVFIKNTKVAYRRINLIQKSNGSSKYFFFKVDEISKIKYNCTFVTKNTKIVEQKQPNKNYKVLSDFVNKKSIGNTIILGFKKQINLINKNEIGGQLYKLKYRKYLVKNKIINTKIQTNLKQKKWIKLKYNNLNYLLFLNKIFFLIKKNKCTTIFKQKLNKSNKINNLIVFLFGNVKKNLELSVHSVGYSTLRLNGQKTQKLEILINIQKQYSNRLQNYWNKYYLYDNKLKVLLLSRKNNKVSKKLHPKKNKTLLVRNCQITKFLGFKKTKENLNNYSYRIGISSTDFLSNTDRLKNKVLSISLAKIYNKNLKFKITEHREDQSFGLRVWVRTSIGKIRDNPWGKHYLTKNNLKQVIKFNDTEKTIKIHKGICLALENFDVRQLGKEIGYAQKNRVQAGAKKRIKFKNLQLKNIVEKIKYTKNNLNLKTSLKIKLIRRLKSVGSKTKKSMYSKLIILGRLKLRKNFNLKNKIFKIKEKNKYDSKLANSLSLHYTKPFLIKINPNIGKINKYLGEGGINQRVRRWHKKAKGAKKYNSIFKYVKKRNTKLKKSVKIGANGLRLRLLLGSGVDQEFVINHVEKELIKIENLGLGQRIPFHPMSILTKLLGKWAIEEITPNHISVKIFFLEDFTTIKYSEATILQEALTRKYKVKVEQLRKTELRVKFLCIRIKIQRMLDKDYKMASRIKELLQNAVTITILRKSLKIQNYSIKKEKRLNFLKIIKENQGLDKNFWYRSRLDKDGLWSFWLVRYSTKWVLKKCLKLSEVFSIMESNNPKNIYKLKKYTSPTSDGMTWFTRREKLMELLGKWADQEILSPHIKKIPLLITNALPEEVQPSWKKLPIYRDRIRFERIGKLMELLGRWVDQEVPSPHIKKTPFLIAEIKFKVKFLKKKKIWESNGVLWFERKPKLVELFGRWVDQEVPAPHIKKIPFLIPEVLFTDKDKKPRKRVRVGKKEKLIELVGEGVDQEVPSPHIKKLPLLISEKSITEIIFKKQQLWSAAQNTPFIEINLQTLIRGFLKKIRFSQNKSILELRKYLKFQKFLIELWGPGADQEVFGKHIIKQRLLSKNSVIHKIFPKKRKIIYKAINWFGLDPNNATDLAAEFLEILPFNKNFIRQSYLIFRNNNEKKLMLLVNQGMLKLELTKLTSKQIWPEIKEIKLFFSIIQRQKKKLFTIMIFQFTKNTKILLYYKKKLYKILYSPQSSKQNKNNKSSRNIPIIWYISGKIQKYKNMQLIRKKPKLFLEKLIQRGVKEEICKSILVSHSCKKISQQKIWLFLDKAIIGLKSKNSSFKKIVIKRNLFRRLNLIHSKVKNRWIPRIQINKIQTPSKSCRMKPQYTGSSRNSLKYVVKWNTIKFNKRITNSFYKNKIKKYKSYYNQSRVSNKIKYVKPLGSIAKEFFLNTYHKNSGSKIKELKRTEFNLLRLKFRYNRLILYKSSMFRVQKTSNAKASKIRRSIFIFGKGGNYKKIIKYSSNRRIRSLHKLSSQNFFFNNIRFYALQKGVGMSNRKKIVKILVRQKLGEKVGVVGILLKKKITERIKKFNTFNNTLIIEEGNSLETIQYIHKKVCIYDSLVKQYRQKYVLDLGEIRALKKYSKVGISYDSKKWIKYFWDKDKEFTKIKKSLVEITKVYSNNLSDYFIILKDIEIFTIIQALFILEVRKTNKKLKQYVFGKVRLRNLNLNLRKQSWKFTKKINKRDSSFGALKAYKAVRVSGNIFIGNWAEISRIRRGVKSIRFKQEQQESYAFVHQNWRKVNRQTLNFGDKYLEEVKPKFFKKNLNNYKKILNIRLLQKNLKQIRTGIGNKNFKLFLKRKLKYFHQGGKQYAFENSILKQRIKNKKWMLKNLGKYKTNYYGEVWVVIQANALREIFEIRKIYDTLPYPEELTRQEAWVVFKKRWIFRKKIINARLAIANAKLMFLKSIAQNLIETKAYGLWVGKYLWGNRIAKMQKYQLRRKKKRALLRRRYTVIKANHLRKKINKILAKKKEDQNLFLIKKITERIEKLVDLGNRLQVYMWEDLNSEVLLTCKRSKVYKLMRKHQLRYGTELKKIRHKRRYRWFWKTKKRKNKNNIKVIEQVKGIRSNVLRQKNLYLARKTIQKKRNKYRLEKVAEKKENWSNSIESLWSKINKLNGDNLLMRSDGGLKNKTPIQNIKNLYFKRKFKEFSEQQSTISKKLYSRAWSHNLKKRLGRINPYTWDNQKTEFQIGMKVGDIDDSSYWSSGTEFINEQYLFDSKVFNQDYVLYGYSEIDEQDINYQQNKYKLAWRAKRNQKNYTDPSIMSEDTGANGGSESVTSDDDEQNRYYTYTEVPRSERAILGAFSDGGAGVDYSYGDPMNIDDNLQLFSYIDWGQDTDNDGHMGTEERMGSAGSLTADLIRDPTTESVYLDFVENEYARELRQFPEEVLDWTVSDIYSDMFYDNEISELPNSTNESEQYSVDSSNSISDYFVEITGRDKDVEDSTEYISDDPSTEYSSLESTSETSEIIHMNKELAFADNYEKNVAPDAHPEVDLFNVPTIVGQKPQSKFWDHSEKSLFEAEKLEETMLSDFGDSSKMELEENTREPETFFKQQKYLNSYTFEGILDEFILLININKDLGLKTYIFDYIVENRQSLSFRIILYKQTNYLKLYRGLMLDLNLLKYMY